MEDEVEACRNRPTVLGVLTAPLALLERTRGRRQLAILAGYFLILACLGALGWRQSRLANLPDVGDPPIPEAGPISDDRNAFSLYRQLKGKITRVGGVRIDLNGYQWDPENPALADLLARNAEALALWRRGTDRPDARWLPAEDPGWSAPTSVWDDLQFVGHLALVEASRSERAGDLAGAWGWYRAILRADRHCARHGPIVGLISGGLVDRHARPRIVIWAADTRVDVPMLRKALADVRDANAMTSTESETLAIEERLAIRALGDPWGLYTRAVRDTSERFGLDVDDRRFRIYQSSRWFLQNEPERSKRLVRLVFANWIEQADRPTSERARPIGKSTWRIPQQIFDAPPSPACPIPAAELGRRFEGADLAGLLEAESFMSGALYQLDRDRSAQKGHLLDLARVLFAREHDGREPETDEDLDRLIRAAPNPSPKP